MRVHDREEKVVNVGHRDQLRAGEVAREGLGAARVENPPNRVRCGSGLRRRGHSEEGRAR